MRPMAFLDPGAFFVTYVLKLFTSRLSCFRIARHLPEVDNFADATRRALASYDEPRASDVRSVCSFS